MDVSELEPSENRASFGRKLRDINFRKGGKGDIFTSCDKWNVVGFV